MIDSPKIPAPFRRTVLWSLLIVAIVGWTAREVVSFEFVSWDDELNILLNPHLGPPTWTNLQWMFGDVAYMRRYVPFGWLGFSAAYAFSGLSPVAYHAAGVLLHVVNSFLLFVAIRWMLAQGGKTASAARRNGCAAVGALFWALHPLRAETVGWSSGMLYSLAGAFALLAVIIYGRAGSSASPAKWRWLAVGFYAISVLTYPITLGLLVVFLALDALAYTAPAKSGDMEKPRLVTLAWEKIPFILTGAGALGITLYGRYTTETFWGAPPSLHDYGFLARAMRAAYTTAWYLWETCWPVRLSPLPTQLSTFAPFGVAAVTGVGVVAAITFVLWRKSPRGGFILWICYLGLLLPMLGFTEKEFYTSDRYTYLPGMIGGVAAAGALAMLPRRFSLAASVTAGAALLVLGMLCLGQLRVWQDSATLFARCIELSGNPQLTESVYRRWVDYHASRGNITAADKVLAEASRLRPAARAEIGAALRPLADEVARGFPPLLARMHAKLALGLVRQNRLREADEHFTAALALAPHFALASYNQALLAAGTGDPYRAQRLMLAATGPDEIGVSREAQKRGWLLIAHAFRSRGEHDLAARALEQAEEIR